MAVRAHSGSARLLRETAIFYEGYFVFPFDPARVAPALPVVGIPLAPLPAS
jgi:hypothetical protein